MQDTSDLIKVLYCDDDNEMLSTVGTYLFWYGLFVDCIGDSSQVAELAENNGYDALIISYWASPADCMEVCRTIRSAPSGNRISILVIAPEDLEASQYRELKENNIYFMTKFRGPEKWFGKIKAMVRNTRKDLESA